VSFTDDAGSALSSGLGMANRAGQAARIGIERTHLSQQRQNLMRELGNVAYPTLRSHPELVPEAQELLTRIIALDQRMSSLDEELKSAKSASAPLATRQSPSSGARGVAVVCPRCGNTIAPGAHFCMACGLSRAEAEKQTRGAR
jgi:ribosomal protein L32